LESNQWCVKRDQDLAALGREIFRLRKARGLTQLQLQRLSGVHPAYVSGIETARRNVGMAAIFKLARALDVHPAALLSTIP
jgi:transcriptional regulator with XRE-family HTH domain